MPNVELLRSSTARFEISLTGTNFHVDNIASAQIQVPAKDYIVQLSRIQMEMVLTHNNSVADQDLEVWIALARRGPPSTTYSSLSEMEAGWRSLEKVKVGIMRRDFVAQTTDTDLVIPAPKLSWDQTFDRHDKYTRTRGSRKGPELQGWGLFAAIPVDTAQIISYTMELDVELEWIGGKSGRTPFDINWTAGAHSLGANDGVA